MARKRQKGEAICLDDVSGLVTGSEISVGNLDQIVIEKFQYQRFREPRSYETFSHFFKEFYTHLEDEFERLVDYMLLTQRECMKGKD